LLLTEKSCIILRYNDQTCVIHAGKINLSDMNNYIFAHNS